MTDQNGDAAKAREGKKKGGMKKAIRKALDKSGLGKKAKRALRNVLVKVAKIGKSKKLEQMADAIAPDDKKKT